MLLLKFFFLKKKKYFFGQCVSSVIRLLLFVYPFTCIQKIFLSINNLFCIPIHDAFFFLNYKVLYPNVLLEYKYTIYIYQLKKIVIQYWQRNFIFYIFFLNDKRPVYQALKLDVLHKKFWYLWIFNYERLDLDIRWVLFFVP